MSVTKELAFYVVDSRLTDIPDDVCHQARRAILNLVGCAVGGSREPAVDTLDDADDIVKGTAPA